MKKLLTLAVIVAGAVVVGTVINLYNNDPEVKEQIDGTSREIGKFTTMLKDRADKKAAEKAQAEARQRELNQSWAEQQWEELGI